MSLNDLIDSIRNTARAFHLSLDEFQIELIATRLYRDVIATTAEPANTKHQRVTLRVVK